MVIFITCKRLRPHWDKYNSRRLYETQSFVTIWYMLNTSAKILFSTPLHRKHSFYMLCKWCFTHSCVMNSIHYVSVGSTEAARGADYYSTEEIRQRVSKNIPVQSVHKSIEHKSEHSHGLQYFLLKKSELIDKVQYSTAAVNHSTRTCNISARA